MHRSSETLGAIAAALAKAQGELANPEKSLIATIQSPFPREGGRTFRYASLASGLDLIRKCLGQHGIATLQTTGIDQQAGQIHLTTVLAHESGEWIASEWPVCPLTQTSTPHLMGAALSYARRYALFALVGIAGEDDLDAPDLLVESSPATSQPTDQSRSSHNGRKSPNGSVHKQATLPPAASAALRDELIFEINRERTADDLAVWAHRRLAAKNTLATGDANAVEAAYIDALNQTENPGRNTEANDVSTTPRDPGHDPSSSALNDATNLDQHNSMRRKLVTPLPKTPRVRSKAHLQFVAARPCLVCQRSPCDAHHIKFAEPRALGAKVSDEFTVPLCREHHQQLHRHGNERAWWANVNVTPLEAANSLWKEFQFDVSSRILEPIRDTLTTEAT